MSDRDTTIASASVDGREGIHKLEWWLSDDQLNTFYTIYEAEPLGLKTNANLHAQTVTRFKPLQWRFDKNQPDDVVAFQDNEYSNKFKIHRSGIDHQALIDTLARSQSAIVQGLRDDKEYLEFALDESFAPFRKALESVATRPESQIKTSAGVVASIRNDNVFMLNGEPTNPRVEGDVELSVEKSVPFLNNVAFLLKNRGGTDCPIQYVWVFKVFAGTTVTPEFGTCAALTEVVERDGSLIVTMPDTPQTTYSFNGYVLLENGKPVKQ